MVPYQVALVAADLDLGFKATNSGACTASLPCRCYFLQLRCLLVHLCCN